MKYRILIAAIIAFTIFGTTWHDVSVESAVVTIPTPSQCESIIFLERRPDSNDKDIVVMKPDGTGRTHLLPPSLRADMAQVSPDGRKIAFADLRLGADRPLYVINTDGSGLLHLADYLDLNSPAFSPDSRKIAFDGLDLVSDEEGSAIYTINVDGTDLTKLTPPTDPDDSHVFEVKSFSPGGSGGSEAGSRHESRAITPEEAETLGIDIRQLAKTLFAARDAERGAGTDLLGNKNLTKTPRS